MDYGTFITSYKVRKDGVKYVIDKMKEGKVIGVLGGRERHIHTQQIRLRNIFERHNPPTPASTATAYLVYPCNKIQFKHLGF